MHEFKDKNGTSWKVDLSLTAIWRIEAYDFSRAMHVAGPAYLQFFPPQDDLFTTKITDPAVCFGIVWCCVEPEAKERGIDNELAFAELFDGDAIERARLALYEELPNFYSRSRISLRTLIGRYEETWEIINDRLQKKINQLMTREAMEKMVDQEMEKIQITG